MFDRGLIVKIIPAVQPDCATATLRHGEQTSTAMLVDHGGQLWTTAGLCKT